MVYNVGDVAGKWGAAALRWPGPSRVGQWATLAAAAARVALVPALMRCNVAPGDRNTEVLPSYAVSKITVHVPDLMTHTGGLRL